MNEPRPERAAGAALAVRDRAATDASAGAVRDPGRDAELTDATGWALFMFGILWTFAVAAIRGGDPVPVGASLWLAAVAMLVGRFGRRISAVLVPGVVVVAGLVIVAVAPGDAITGSPTGGLLGNPSARAALFVVALSAAMMLASAEVREAVRVASIAASGAFIAAVAASGSLSGMIGAAGVVTVALVSARMSARRITVVCAVMAGTVLAATVAIGWIYEPGRPGVLERSASATITVRRAALWNEAIDLVATHPILGVGPGRFASESPTARSDRDARWAHNGFLQQAAETGVVGGALLIAMTGWVFVTLARRPGASRAGPIAAGALAAFVAGASVDYLMHFPVVTAGVAMLAGAGIAPRERG